MNLTLRKLAMLEQSLDEREKQAMNGSYVSGVIDRDLHDRVSGILNKARVI